MYFFISCLCLYFERHSQPAILFYKIYKPLFVPLFLKAFTTAAKVEVNLSTLFVPLFLKAFTTECM